MPNETVLIREKNGKFFLGVGITLVIAGIAKSLALLPFLNIVGELMIAILIGMLWRSTVGVSNQTIVGADFSSKKLLRLGIILLGMRLNLFDLAQAGSAVFIIASISLVFALIVVYLLTKLFHVDKKLGILISCGTAICGAAAIAAIAPQVKGKNAEIAIGAATVAILGTIFTLIYTLLFPIIGLSDYAYGIFAGATLHEIAHVLAAANTGGNAAVEIAIIVKLTRVTLLIPVAILIGIWMNKTETNQNTSKWKVIPIPWFIVGFLMTSGLNSMGLVPSYVAEQIVIISYLLLGMAMAGLGLSVQATVFQKHGVKAFAAGFVGSVLLSIFGYLCLQFFSII
ncbi:YeiH family protein [Halalkalibacterium ligniniphilum]|uniref:YeiH family protein n=1 Tax=Halalkalibacterium ligniniphilum TaxID=1134413 RepID=UPI00034B1D53|nr:putative sulfate exporter family transporter [Halalkalibacterium ligniniphilum]